MILTEDLWKAMLEVNYTVNSSITPLTDMEIYGVEERWTIPAASAIARTSPS